MYFVKKMNLILYSYFYYYCFFFVCFTFLSSLVTWMTSFRQLLVPVTKLRQITYPRWLVTCPSSHPLPQLRFSQRAEIPNREGWLRRAAGTPAAHAGGEEEGRTGYARQGSLAQL